MTKRSTSEFGKGLGYCLGLFIGHEFRLGQWLRDWKEIREKEPNSAQGLFTESRAVELWFNGAADHFFDFQPDAAPKHLRKRCRRLQNKCIAWRMDTGKGGATIKDARWAIQEAKDLLRLIDKSHGVSTQKGEYE